LRCCWTGECPEWQRELTVNQPSYDFEGSSPSSPTSLRWLRQLRLGRPLSQRRLPRDEFIDAGDAHFQEKARERVHQFVSRARILLLASHSKDLCRSMCNKALVLNKGENVFFGEIEEGLAAYERLG
jgi:hypothetical protein